MMSDLRLARLWLCWRQILRFRPSSILSPWICLPLLTRARSQSTSPDKRPACLSQAVSHRRHMSQSARHARPQQHSATCRNPGSDKTLHTSGCLSGAGCEGGRSPDPAHRAAARQRGAAVADHHPPQPGLQRVPGPAGGSWDRYLPQQRPTVSDQGVLLAAVQGERGMQAYGLGFRVLNVTGRFGVRV